MTQTEPEVPPAPDQQDPGSGQGGGQLPPEVDEDVEAAKDAVMDLPLGGEGNPEDPPSHDDLVEAMDATADLPLGASAVEEG